MVLDLALRYNQQGQRGRGKVLAPWMTAPHSSQSFSCHFIKQIFHHIKKNNFNCPISFSWLFRQTNFGQSPFGTKFQTTQHSANLALNTLSHAEKCGHRGLRWSGSFWGSMGDLEYTAHLVFRKENKYSCFTSSHLSASFGAIDSHTLKSYSNGLLLSWLSYFLLVNNLILFSY